MNYEHICCLDITQAIQDITNIKPRQKFMAKKVLKKKDLTPKDVMDSTQEEKNGRNAGEDASRSPNKVQEEWVKRKEQRPVLTGMSPQDVPDGAQISKAFDTLCNIVRDRMRRYKKPEPIADFYTKGRYVLVTGDSSYPDPCFCTSTPSAGHIFVTIRDGMTPPYELYGRSTPTPPPAQPMVDPRPLSPTLPSDERGSKDGGVQDANGGKGKNKTTDPRPKEPSPVIPPSEPSSNKDPTPTNKQPKKSKDDSEPSGPTPKPAPRVSSTSSSSSSNSSTSTSSTTSSGSFSPESMSYEKVEVVESVEKFSHDRKMKGYEETSMVVETVIEKSSKKKH